MFPDPAPSRISVILRHPLVRLALICAVLALTWYPWLPFPWRMPVVGLLGLLFVWAETRSLTAMGLQRQSTRASLLWAVLLFAIVFGPIVELLMPLVNMLVGAKSDHSAYGALHGNLPATVRLIAYAWLSAAIGEELVFRAFLMHQLHALFDRFRQGALMAAVVCGVIFGLIHAQQGITGIVMTGVVGTVLSYAYLRSNRNLYALILAHGLIDTWGVSRLYLGW